MLVEGLGSEANACSRACLAMGAVYIALRNAGQGNAKAVAQPTADRRRGSWLAMLRIVAYNEETEGPGLLFDSEINVSVTKQELMSNTAKWLVSAYIYTRIIHGVA